MPISCLLLPHAAAPVTEGTAWTELNDTLEEVDNDSINVGLPRFNVFIFTVRAAIRAHTSIAPHGHRASRPNVLEALMVRRHRA